MSFEAVYYSELPIACGFLKQTHVIDSVIFETAKSFNFFLWSYRENISRLTSQITRELIRDSEIREKYRYSLKYIFGNQPKLNNWWGNDFLDSYDKFDYTTVYILKIIEFNTNLCWKPQVEHRLRHIQTLISHLKFTDKKTHFITFWVIRYVSGLCYKSLF